MEEQTTILIFNSFLYALSRATSSDIQVEAAKMDPIVGVPYDIKVFLIPQTKKKNNFLYNQTSAHEHRGIER